MVVWGQQGLPVSVEEAFRMAEGTNGQLHALVVEFDSFSATI